MAVISNSVMIRCQMETVFDYLSDHRNELDWNPAIETIEKLTDGPVGLGTKFGAKWKSSPHVVVEIVEYDRPHRWATHNGGPIEATVSFRLEPVELGTMLYADFEAVPHGWFRLIFPLFLARLRKQERANMSCLRDALEQRVSH
jgi:Polyketide cyclase / dehydrase and lipid transport